ncbi:hypothetical protein Dimus_025388 [Dionaea muscipula]
MGALADEEEEMIEPPSSILELPIFSSLPPMRVEEDQHPPGSSMVSSPLHTAASVPFRWEEQPGKPRPCTVLSLPTTGAAGTPKCLELPPRLLYSDTNTASPTTVLTASTGSGRSIFQSYSFRFIRVKTTQDQDQDWPLYDGGISGENSSPRRRLLGAPLVVSSSSTSCRSQLISRDRSGLFGSLRRRAFSSRIERPDVLTWTEEDEEEETTGAKVKISMKRKRSLLGVSEAARPSFWVSVFFPPPSSSSSSSSSSSIQFNERILAKLS